MGVSVEETDLPSLTTGHSEKHYAVNSQKRSAPDCLQDSIGIRTQANRPFELQNKELDSDIRKKNNFVTTRHTFN